MKEATDIRKTSEEMIDGHMKTDMLVEVINKIDTTDMKSSLVVAIVQIEMTTEADAMIEEGQKCILSLRMSEFRCLEKDLVIMTVIADAVVTIEEATTEEKEVEVK